MMKRAFRTLPLAAFAVVALAAPATAAVINGTDGPDALVGTSKADTMRGHAGNDSLRGLAGADKLYGGPGADRLHPGKDSQQDVLRGGDGNDRIWVRIGSKGHGADYAYGGNGNDWIRIVNTYGWLAPRVSCGPGHDTVVLPRGFDTRIGGCEHIVSGPSQPPAQ